jgi:Acetyltransferase (GNAT) domain
VGSFAQPEVWRFPFGRGFTRDETESFLLAQVDPWSNWGFGLWVARLRTGDRILGYIGLSIPTFLPEILPAVEVGWRLVPTAWGKGLRDGGSDRRAGRGVWHPGTPSGVLHPPSGQPRLRPRRRATGYGVGARGRYTAYPAPGRGSRPFVRDRRAGVAITTVIVRHVAPPEANRRHAFERSIGSRPQVRDGGGRPVMPERGLGY